MAFMALASGAIMPTLFRLLVIVGILVGLGYASLFTLATFLTPEMRAITVVIPPHRLPR